MVARDTVDGDGHRLGQLVDGDEHGGARRAGGRGEEQNGTNQRDERAYVAHGSTPSSQIVREYPNQRLSNMGAEPAAGRPAGQSSVFCSAGSKVWKFRWVMLLIYNYGVVY